MALGTEEIAYNAALIVLITAWKAVIDAATTGEVLQITPLDVGQDSSVNTGIAAAAAGTMAIGTGPRPSFQTVVAFPQVNDGEFPIVAPGYKHPGGPVPLFWAITNQAHELDVV